MSAEYAKISVVTPSFNQGSFLEATINSVLDQSYPNLEYIVMDGGSSDETVDILQRYSSQITSWVSEPDRGQSHAINKGFEKSTGDILCWLNSDDILLPGSLAFVAEQFSPKPGFSYGCGQVLRLENNGQAKGRLPFKEHASLQEWFTHYRDKRPIFLQPATFWSRKVWEEVGPLREDLHYAFDFEFFLKARIRFGEPAYWDRELAGFRFHDASKTCMGSEPFLLENLQIVRENLKALSPEEYSEVRSWLLEERSNECFLRQQDSRNHSDHLGHMLWRGRSILHRLSGKRFLC